MEIPQGVKYPRLGHLPEIASFVRTDRERKLLELWRVFRRVGSPYVLPPDTPNDRVEILQDAMRKTLKDPEFHGGFRKLVSDEVQPLMPEELTKILRETPRDTEVIDLLKTLAGAGPLPHR